MCDLYQPCKTMLSIGFATARTYLLDFALPVFFRIRLFHFKLISFDEGLDFEEGDLHFCILKKYVIFLNYCQLFSILYIFLPVIIYSLYLSTLLTLFMFFHFFLQIFLMRPILQTPFRLFSMDFQFLTRSFSEDSVII